MACRYALTSAQDLPVHTRWTPPAPCARPAGASPRPRAQCEHSSRSSSLGERMRSHVDTSAAEGARGDVTSRFPPASGCSERGVSLRLVRCLRQGSLAPFLTAFCAGAAGAAGRWLVSSLVVCFLQKRKLRLRRSAPGLDCA